MKDFIFSNSTFYIGLVIGSYFLGTIIYKRTRFALFHPCIISMMIIIPILKYFDIPYSNFFEGSKFIHYLLGPTVVSLGVLLYDQAKYLKGNVLTILSAILVGSIVGIVSVIIMGYLLGLDSQMIHSIEPKSVTTPIAMGLSLNNGGNPSLTAVCVVICGIFGAIAGPKIHSLFKINSPIAQGLSMGAAAHGLGTAKAMEIGAVQGAIGGLAIGLMGIMTSISLPLIHWFIHFLIHLKG